MPSRAYNLGGSRRHIILSDYATTVTAFVARAASARVVAKASGSRFEVCHKFRPLPQILKMLRSAHASRLDDAEVNRPSFDARSASTPWPPAGSFIRHRSP